MKKRRTENCMQSLVHRLACRKHFQLGLLSTFLLSLQFISLLIKKNLCCQFVLHWYSSTSVTGNCVLLCWSQYDNIGDGGDVGRHIMTENRTHYYVHVLVIVL